MTETFPWFAARLLFEAASSRHEPEMEPLFEERVLLVHSPSGFDEAMKKAHKLGKASGDSYDNEQGDTVTWTFKEVLDLVQLNESSIGEGTEVYHHFLKPEELDQVRESLKSGSL